MKIFITGGNGFIGKHLSRALLEKGHEVTVTGTRRFSGETAPPNFRYISADTTQEGAWQDAAATADVLFNLAGRTILKRWTKSYKRQVYESRILSTRQLVQAIQPGRGTVFISTSAVGFYGNRGDDILTETEPPGADFLSLLSKNWELEALEADKKGVRTVIARFGVVLGQGGGALAGMLPAFKWFVGGPLGDGSQWVPWIHVDDLTAALQYVMTNNQCRGIYNFCSPEPVRYRDLAAALGQALGRPSFLRTPGIAVRLALGEAGKVLLAGQRAIPDRLMQAGYAFQYTAIDSALRNLLPASR